MAIGSGTKDDPWQLKTPPGTSDYTIYLDDAADPPQLVCQVGSTRLGYQAQAIDDLHAWLKEQGDWVPLGAADESKDAAPGTVEAWGRSADNPVGGWYGDSEGLSRPIRDVHPTAARGARAGRSRAQPAQQPHAGDLSARHCGALFEAARIGDDSPSMPRRGPCRPSSPQPRPSPSRSPT